MESSMQMKLTDNSPINNGRVARNAAMTSIFNDSDQADLLDLGTSKFKTKFVDMKSRDMQKSRYEKMVAKQIEEDRQQQLLLEKREKLAELDDMKHDLSVDLSYFAFTNPAFGK